MLESRKTFANVSEDFLRSATTEASHMSEEVNSCPLRSPSKIAKSFGPAFVSDRGLNAPLLARPIFRNPLIASEEGEHS